MTLVPDFDPFYSVPKPIRPVAVDHIGGSTVFWRAKAVADLAGAVFLLPVIAGLAVLLSCLNPLFNPGPLLFRQDRMGQHGARFTAIKFRTMAHAPRHRGPDDPVEAEHIPRLGRILRRMGLDELPQAINILRGEMSLIGPRPDCATHAQVFLETIPEYRHRLTIKPGMSGYAQITLGYAVGQEATRAKARADIDYIARAGFGLDLWITWQTILTVLTARGD